MEPVESDPLAPELQEAETTLDTALSEACAADPPSKADTGELIRVDELLATASDAIKRTISLRRKRRADTSARHASHAAMADVESEASADATHRILRDGRGMRWDVYAVYPDAQMTTRTQLRGTYSQGWLCFDSASEKRRLSPIPRDWHKLTNEQLAELAGRAEVASSRATRAAPTSDREPPPRPE